MKNCFNYGRNLEGVVNYPRLEIQDFLSEIRLRFGEVLECEPNKPIFYNEKFRIFLKVFYVLMDFVEGDKGDMDLVDLMQIGTLFKSDEDDFRKILDDILNSNGQIPKKAACIFAGVLQGGKRMNSEKFDGYVQRVIQSHPDPIKYRQDSIITELHEVGIDQEDTYLKRPLFDEIIFKILKERPAPSGWFTNTGLSIELGKRLGLNGPVHISKIDNMISELLSDHTYKDLFQTDVRKFINGSHYVVDHYSPKLSKIILDKLIFPFAPKDWNHMQYICYQLSSLIGQKTFGHVRFKRLFNEFLFLTGEKEDDHCKEFLTLNCDKVYHYSPEAQKFMKALAWKEGKSKNIRR